MTIPSLRAIRILLVIALLFGYSAHAEELFSHANSLYPTFYGERSIDIDIDGDGFRDIFSSSSQWGQGMAAFTLTLHKNLPVDCFATTIAAHLETLSEFLDLTV
ncbi:hypothetical protein MRY87_03100, partial [bacterium]|nr:hypothetical protein [bacterium]